jgi:predicted outer membrane repeat protein
MKIKVVVFKMYSSGFKILKKRNIICILILVMFLYSISCVCAEESSEVEVVVNDTGSFTDLENDLNTSESEISFTHDYTFNSTRGDTYGGISIEKNITINGNNHVIDAANKTRIFNFDNSNVIINNLIIKNANGGAIYSQSSNITTNNVTFIHNTKEYYGGAILGLETNYSSNNDRFIDNYAQYGSAIYLYTDSILEMNGSSFSSSLPIEWSLIGLKETEMMIVNTTFANVSSQYCSAIYSIGGKGKIRASRFINLFANKTAGAIGFKDIEKTITIENCTFINSTSRKNGGAVYAEAKANEVFLFFEPEKSSGKFELKDCRFMNCSSAFGGAYLQLNGELNMVNCNFTDNKGYAVYTACVDSVINNTEFRDNPEGALFFLNGDLKVYSSKFINNSDSKKAVHLYEAKYLISNSIFNHTSIYTNFDEKNCILNKNTYISSARTLNQKDYLGTLSNDDTVVDYLKTITFVDDTVLKSYFDLRDYGLVSPVKNQGQIGACWAFAISSALESSLLKAGITLDISENNIAKLSTQYNPYGIKFMDDGGDNTLGLSYFLSWLGPISEDEDDYDELGKVTTASISNHHHMSLDVIMIDGDEAGIKDIKELLVKYGAVYSGVLADYELGDFNYMYNAAYVTEEFCGIDHAICIVGWDDNFSKYKFETPPPGNGAWIAKNSWGDDWADNGYYYISYYDQSITDTQNTFIAFKVNPETYNRNYQHDYYASQYIDKWPFDTMSYGNSYISEGDDYIAAVGTYFGYEGDDYTIYIYINDYLVYTQEGVSTISGFETVKLNSYVSINKNDWFDVEIESQTLPTTSDLPPDFKKGQSFYRDNNGKFHYFTDEVPILKVYTIPKMITTQNMIQYYSNDNKVQFTISDIYGKKVTIKVDKKKYEVAIKDHKAVLNLKLEKGNHIVTTYYKGKKIINQILIKSTIKGDRNPKRPYKVKTTYSVKFLDENGKPLKNQAVKVKFKGKTIKGKTDKNGMFTIKISPKLKKGMHYIKYTNPKTKEKLKIGLKIVKRFKSKDMKMYYFDESKFKVRILGDDGKYLGKGETVTLKIDKKTYKCKTNKNGWVRFEIPSKVKPGKHKIKVSYKGQSVKNTLKVREILKSKKVTVKKSDKVVLKAQLKKDLYDKKVTFKFEGKKYKARTNFFGVAKVTINKKLKKGKYTYKTSYYKTSVKNVLIVE